MAEIITAKRSRVIWLQTKMLTVFLLPSCFWLRRLTSIDRFAMKPMTQMPIRKTPRSGPTFHDVEKLMPSCEFVVCGPSWVYVASSSGAEDVIGSTSVVIVACWRSANNQGLFLKCGSSLATLPVFCAVRCVQETTNVLITTFGEKVFSVLYCTKQ